MKAKHNIIIYQMSILLAASVA